MAHYNTTAQVKNMFQNNFKHSIYTLLPVEYALRTKRTFRNSKVYSVLLFLSVTYLWNFNVYIAIYIKVITLVSLN